MRLPISLLPPTLQLRARTAIGVAALSCALAAAGCGSDSTPTGIPPVPDPGPPPAPLMRLVGDPRVNVNVQGFANRTAAGDTASGYFYVTLTDSLSRYDFITDVSLNGVDMRPERNSLDSPFRYSLRPADLGPGYAVADTLHFAFTDTSGVTTSFALGIVPSTLSLAPDGAVISQAKDLVMRWNGSPQLVRIKFSDHNGTQVSANLQFQNVTGASQVLIRSQDLKQLATGTLTVSADVQAAQIETTARPRHVQASMDVLETRAWKLAP